MTHEERVRQTSRRRSLGSYATCAWRLIVVAVVFLGIMRPISIGFQMAEIYYVAVGRRRHTEGSTDLKSIGETNPLRAQNYLGVS